MPLENTGQILDAARKAGYCVGAFNVFDHLSLESVINAAQDFLAPVIIQTSSGTVRRFGAKQLVAMTRTLSDDLSIPVGLHLDHGTEMELIQECIDAGYTSVMIDASHFPFVENVLRTRMVVENAHEKGVAVEGEIGILAGVEDDLVVQQDKAIYTTPEEAIQFQAESGVDFLAVAIGTAHGFYKVEPRLDIETLRVLHESVEFPLVIHGGTGLSMSILSALVSAGASKLNISTQIKKVFIDSLGSYIKTHPGEYDPIKMLKYTRGELMNTVSDYLEVLGSKGRINEESESLS